MWTVILLATCVLWGANDAEATSKNMQKRNVGSYSGSYSGSNGANGGYVGNYNDYDDIGYAPDYGFGFGFFDPYAFHQQLTAQIMAQNAAHQNMINRQQAAFFDNIRRQNDYKAKQNNRYAPNYSAAAASLGPEGGYQTAFISPENPDIPNISNRFSPSSPDGFKGVSVSSYSSSSDINGKKTSHRAAQTTINDNGRITTYKVNS